ncbi:MAG: DUF493 domain-containing protein [Epsilonproteobacteria bacterium]|nr:DUF493 domain-containing protein [Campylobacterota bacterium]
MDKKPDIEYPCQWGYKLIGTDKAKLETCIFDVMAHRDYKCKVGNTSSKGKFISMNTSCEVSSQEERDALFKAFQDHCDVKMVI